MYFLPPPPPFLFPLSFGELGVLQFISSLECKCFNGGRANYVQTQVVTNCQLKRERGVTMLTGFFWKKKMWCVILRHSKVGMVVVW